MRIHNKLEIKLKDKVYTSYNNLLLPFAESLSEGGNYSKYLAIGTGKVQDDIFHLARFSSRVELVDDSYNFNPLNGQLYLRKKWVLAETDNTPYEIVEVGLTADGESDNPRIANRFLVNNGEPIYRDAGEEMVFMLTIYLEFDNSSNLKLTGGDNALVKFFLGAGDRSDFYVARGYDATDNDTVVVRDAVGVERVLVTPVILVEDNPPRITFNFEGSLSPGGITEFLLFIGEEAVARQNVQNVFGGTKSLKIELMPDEDGVITLTTPDVQAVNKVVVKSTGEEVSDYNIIPYALGFQGAFEEVFNGLGLPSGGRVLNSKIEDRIAFFDGDGMRVFIMTDTGAEELDATLINTKDGYLFLIYEDMIFIKCAHEDGTYSFRYYKYNVKNSNRYQEYTAYLSNSSYNGVNLTDYWYDMDGFTMDKEKNNSEFMLVLTSEVYIYGYKTLKQSSGDLYNIGRMLSGGFKARTCAMMEPANTHQNVFVGYSPSSDRMIYRKNNVFYGTEDRWAASVVRDYQDAGYPKVAKNYAYAVDDANQMIKLFSIDLMQGKSIVFEGAKNIYMDNKLNYAVVKYNSGVVRAFYIDASANIYEFSTSVPELEDEIDNFYVVGEYFVFKLKNNKYFRIKLNKSMFSISPLPKEEIEVEIMADTTPGQGGGPLGFSATVKVSAEDGGGEDS